MIAQKPINFQAPSKQHGSAALWALLGLGGFVALAWFCIARHVPVLEQRLQASVTSAITPLNAGTVNVAINGYQAQLNGAVKDPETRNNLIAAASAVTGVRSVADNLEIIAPPVTANLDAVDSAADASEDAAEDPAIVQSEVPEVPANSVALSDTSTPEQSDSASAATEPAELNIAVTDRSLTVTGRVQNRRNLTSIIESVMTTFDLNYLSNNVETSSDIVPMEWRGGLVTIIPELSNIKNPSIDVFDNQITLSGNVSSENDEQNIVNSVRTALPSFAIVNRLQIDTTQTPTPTDDTPTDQTSTDTNAIDESTEDAEISRLEAEAEENARLEAEAKAATEAEEKARVEAEAIAAAQAAEKSRLEAKEKAAAASREREAIQAAVDPIEQAAKNLSIDFTSLDDTRILFLSGGNTLTEDSRERLERIGELLAEYPNVPVAIKGHTDSQGDDNANLSLSQLRANAVRDFLVARGISAFRLSSFGFGEGLPITTNDTSEGRSANRRIEFSF